MGAWIYPGMALTPFNSRLSCVQRHLVENHWSILSLWVIHQWRHKYLIFQLVDSNGILNVPDTGKRLAREASSSCLSFTSVSCKRIVADFRFLREFERTIAEPYSKPDNQNQSRTGTLLKMLLSQMDYSDRQANQVSFKHNFTLKNIFIDNFTQTILKP